MDDSVHPSCYTNPRPNGIATSNFGIERITGDKNPVHLIITTNSVAPYFILPAILIRTLRYHKLAAMFLENFKVHGQFTAMLSSRNSSTVKAISDLKCKIVSKRISGDCPIRGMECHFIISARSTLVDEF